MAQTKNKIRHVRNLTGLSSDNKPIYDIDGDGAIFREVDTGNVYVYNAATKRWILDKNKSESHSDIDVEKLPEEQIFVGVQKIYKNDNYHTENPDADPLKDEYIIKYTNGSTYKFYLMNGAKGDQGEPGKDMDKVVLRYNENGKAGGPWADQKVVQWKHNSLPDLDENWNDLFQIATISQGYSPQIRETDGHWMVQENGSVVDSGISAYPHNIELRKTSTTIQYRIVTHDGDEVEDWTDFVNLTDIQGATGVGITSVTKTGATGLVDTYTINYSDGNISTFEITNGAQGEQGATGLKGDTGNSIYSVDLDSYDETTGISVYRITYTNEDFTTFTVKDGAQGPKGDQGKIGPKTIFKKSDDYLQYKAENDSEWTNLIPLSDLVGATGAQGVDGKNGTNGLNGNGISKIEKVSTVGNVDIYQITYTNGGIFTFNITNGTNSTILSSIDWSDDKKTLSFNFSDGSNIDVDFSDFSKNLINVDDGELGQFLIITEDDQGHKSIGYSNGYTAGNGININNNEITANLTYISNNMTYVGSTSPIGATIGGLSRGTVVENWTIKKLLDTMLYPYEPPKSVTIRGISGGHTYEIGTDSDEFNPKSISSLSFSVEKGTEPITQLKVKYQKDSSSQPMYLYGTADTYGEYTSSISFNEINFETSSIAGRNQDIFTAIVSDGRGSVSNSITVNNFKVYDYYAVINSNEELDLTNLTRTSVGGTEINIESGKTLYYLSKNSGNLKVKDDFTGNYESLDVSQFYEKLSDVQITLQSGLINQTYHVHKLTPLMAGKQNVRV